MTIKLQCLANCDDVLLTWQVTDPADGSIPGCLGFAVEIKDQTGKVEALSNLKGFAADQPQTGQTQPTTTWPLQTYEWIDHSILVGNQVQFQVTAMMGTPGNLTRGETSGWSGVQTLTTAIDAKTSVFFNRGVILSQFVTRFAKQNNLTTTKALKAALGNEVTSPIMQFLCGELGKAIRGILKQAQADPKIEIYCALFELDLPDLIDGLIALGNRAHVVLSNGSVAKAGGDENSAAAAQLQGKVDLHRRMVAPKGLGHNKFAVVCMNGQPFGVWTGSTNWTLTGLHTQINNGIAVEDAALAQAYLDHWHALVAAGDAFTSPLKSGDANAQGPFPLVAPQQARAWFSPQAAGTPGVGGADIEDLMALVNAAKQGILFIMFMPGQEPLTSILKRQEGGLYVRGVVSTLPTGTKDKPSGTFQIMNGKDFKQYSLDVIQPQGAQAVGDFLAEFSRQQFLTGIGFAITHSKVIVIDPFGDKPVLVTGSHNLSVSASEKNDENLLIIENCPELARAYAVNCMSVYKTYRWPAYQHDAQNANAKDDGYLAITDAWQTTALNADTLADLKFWLGA
jgi:phospholipase D-like protein